MQLVQNALLDLCSDCTLGYKTQRGFGAVIESLTTQTTPQQTLYSLLYSLIIHPPLNSALPGEMLSPALLDSVNFAIIGVLGHTHPTKR